MTIASMLPSGRKVRVITPSRSLAIVRPAQVMRAKDLLEANGFSVSFGKSAFKVDVFDEASLADRLADFHAAIYDPDIDIVMSGIGGFSSSDLLRELDYTAIKRSGKIFCGFSDVSVLLNAITFQSRVVTFCGPHFSSFGNPHTFVYTLNSFLSARGGGDVSYVAPTHWGDDLWPEEGMWSATVNLGPKILREGRGLGAAIGGNIPSLVGNLLSSPDEQYVIFLESHPGFSFRDLLRWSSSLVRSFSEGSISALLLGKLGRDLILDDGDWEYLCDKLAPFVYGPIVRDLDFGHNVPFFTIRLGGQVCVDAMRGNLSIIQKATVPPFK